MLPIALLNLCYAYASSINIVCSNWLVNGGKDYIVNIFTKDYIVNIFTKDYSMSMFNFLINLTN